MYSKSHLEKNDRGTNNGPDLEKGNSHANPRFELHS